MIKTVNRFRCDAGNSYPYTGIKTPYSKVYNGTINHINLPNCKPLQIWLLCRHGTRFPKTTKILEMLNMTRFRDLIVNNHEIDHRGQLCRRNLRALKRWRSFPELDATKGKHLSLQGRKDLSSLGNRLRRKFPELFVEDVPEKYKFRSTNTPRTIDSMMFFVKGSFKDTFSVKLEVGSASNDTLLKIYENCEPWEKERFSKEVTAFINGSEMTKVITDISRRLGFVNNISKEDAFLLYDMCRFERAWQPSKESPWCAAFTDEDMHVFEYEEDLYHYYSVGPGREINSKLGCHPLRDMVDRFTKLENAEDSDEPRGVFYFTHSEMIMLFYSVMEIGKNPVHLTASNYRDMQHRNWRTSLLVPFATNFATVFYRCDSSDSPFKIAFYLAEKPLTLEGCNNGVCDWAQLKKKLVPIAANCSTEVCWKTS
ncbi:Multiple inositol polyphosphate phosphatase [Ooceraea biroi]|uniref:Multiple inositol polyphosphate phosphatase 1 n=2 Tax=Ooceraea biroi TaxID=2015173 RepID=A0A026WEW2_OOCBI|nr:Multiple inositol polyphosphate phosphatase [Ooceraea biroi]